VAARADDRQKLERLCRYICRPAVAEKRLSLTPGGNVRYELKTPYRDGTIPVIFKPLAKINASPLSQELPLVAVSGTGVMSDVVEALRAGAWDFVAKPIQDMKLLEHVVHEALLKARLIRDNRRYQHDLEQANRALQDSLGQMREDADTGRRIQTQLMPERRLDFEPYRASYSLLPAMVMSGDFVDYFAIDKNLVGFYIADVSGHGVSSALVTVLLKSCINRKLERLRRESDTAILQPARLLAELNHDLLQQRLEKYLTIFYGVLDQTANRLDYSIGGHFPPAVLYDGVQASFLPGRGPPVGLIPGASYSGEEISLPQRFALALFSDGILEVLPGADLGERQAWLLASVRGFDADAGQIMTGFGLNEDQGHPDDITLLLLTKGHQA
jgi:serine phosphatase RsbU (regulator of sigma subunit)